MRSLSFALLGALTALTHAATPAEWRSKSVYQVLTDRFARTDGSTTASCNTEDRKYCGGTYQGIINKLDYIQGMGFTAIWISPVVENIEETTAYGAAYHGYWAKDIYALNSNFGTAADLVALSAAIHARGMYLMVDVAPNHFAWSGTAASVDYSEFVPFNSEDYFHSFCFISDYSNQENVEDCWLGDNSVPLVDVNTGLTTVQTEYHEWIAELVSNYSIDGLRIDTVKHVQKDFWPDFEDASGVYCVGEVYSGDASYTCPYQNYLSGVLNFPVYYPLIRAFTSSSGSISELVSMISTVKSSCADSTLLGTFSENHDLPRFGSITSDTSLAKNVIAFNIMADGIPIIYEGQEHFYTGASDPANREAIWFSGYDTTATLYTHVASLNQIRNRAIEVSGDTYLTYQAWVIYSDTNSLAIRKGDIVTVMTNLGSSGSATLSVTSTGYTAGATVVDVLSCTTLTVGTSGTLSVSITSGLPKVFYPSASLSGSGICSL
ncbi:uncharacterized protein LAJ45_04044 [Morchella importuna]|uniref:alpha-amylase n=1 Tax=Morchella conica CCBAS932 TaxID=1392247 RepID=A0A3N4L117_9PEZI|nr:uncharacterized protein LAJ45_04044 [Morchella importuna]KAH8152050.1 hypothetical protein LAJ45_04044 [Morchella importuna]RPB16514.1 alpha-amylase [Morchella conica CCBAS932]